MKTFPRFLLYILIPLILAGNAACIHTYPKGEAEDPTLISLSLALSTDDYSASQPLPAATYRFLTLISNNSRVILSQESYVTFLPSSSNPCIIKIERQIPPQRYDILIWGEIVDPITHSPFHYDASDLSHIRILPYWESKYTTAAQLAPPLSLRGETSLDPRSLSSNGNRDLILPVSLTNPVGMLSIQTTDAEPFISRFPSVKTTPGAFSICLTCTSPKAESFNLYAGEPGDYTEGIEINTPILIPDPSASTILHLPIFANSSGEDFTADITIYNSARSIISRTRDIKFHIKPGETSLLKGAFLSNYFENPLKVENEWEGEIIIDH